MGRRIYIEVESPEKLTPKWRLIGVAIILLSLGFTVFFWWVLATANSNAAQSRLNVQVSSTINVIEKRIDGFSDILYGMRALYLTSANITDQQWRAFISTQDIYKRYPGIGNIFFAEARSDEGGQSAYITRSVRDITINVQGVDLMKSPIVAPALNAAVETQSPRATTPYDSPLPEREGKHDAFILLPLYDRVLSTDATLEQKQQLVKGYGMVSVYPSRLFPSTFESIGLSSEIAFVATDEDTVLYSQGNVSGPHIQRTATMNVGGRTWSLQFSAPKNYGVSAFEQMTPVVFVIGGIAFMLLFLTLYFYRNGIRIGLREKVR